MGNQVSNNTHNGTSFNIQRPDLQHVVMKALRVWSKGLLSELTHVQRKIRASSSFYSRLDEDTVLALKSDIRCRTYTDIWIKPPLRYQHSRGPLTPEPDVTLLVWYSLSSQGRVFLCNMQNQNNHYLLSTISREAWRIRKHCLIFVHCL